VTEDEVVDLLTAAAMFDRRTVGRSDAKAWTAVVGDLPFGDALAAVRAHYTESSDWLMPAHVRNRVKIMRRDRLSREIMPAPAPELTDDTIRYRESIFASIESIANGKTVGRALAAGRSRGPGRLSAAEMAALKARLGTAAPKLTPQETAELQAAESRAERETADREEPDAR
jgi:hypothetical protein